jgi:hypothetical protein
MMVHCEYRRAKSKTEVLDTIAWCAKHETSGLFSDNLLWTTNDDTDTTVYGVDTSSNSKGNGLEKYPTKTGRTFHRTEAIFILAILEIMPLWKQKRPIF